MQLGSPLPLRVTWLVHKGPRHPRSAMYYNGLTCGRHSADKTKLLPSQRCLAPAPLQCVLCPTLPPPWLLHRASLYLPSPQSPLSMLPKSFQRHNFHSTAVGLLPVMGLSRFERHTRESRDVPSRSGVSRCFFTVVHCFNRTDNPKLVESGYQMDKVCSSKHGKPWEPGASEAGLILQRSIPL